MAKFTDETEILHEAEEVRRRRLSPTAYKATLRIGARWGLPKRRCLDLIGLSDEQSNAAHIILAADQFHRSQMLIEIFRCLNEVFDNATADRWPAQVNAANMFNGLSPVQMMRHGGTDAMVEVLQHLRAIQQGI